MTSLAVDRNSGEEKAFREFAFQTNFLVVGTSSLMTVVVAQPQMARQYITHKQ